MKRLKYGDPIEVFWHDSFGCSEWTPKDIEPELLEVRQLGYFMKETKKGIFLTNGITVQSHGNVLGVSFIPRGCVNRVRRLK